MRKWSLALVSCLAASSVWASTNSGQLSAATQELLDTYPGLSAYVGENGLWAFHGQKMTSADTPAQAVEWWIADHGDAFNVADLDLRLERTNAVSPEQTWTVFAHKQYMDGVPVEFGFTRMVVHNGSPNTVVLVTGKLATPPVEGFSPVNLNADQALEFAQGAYPSLTVWGTPELVVFYGQDETIGAVTPVKTWKIRGENTLVADDFKAESLFVNATDGSIVFVRNEKHYADVSGQVHGMGTPWGKDACRPDIPDNAPIDLIMGDVQINVNGVIVQSSDGDGSFVVVDQGNADTTVATDLVGPWARNFNDSGAELTLSVPFTVGQENVDVFYNPAPSEFLTAQVNGHIHANAIHDFYVLHQPGFTNLNQIQNHVNVNGSCNAFYSGNTINHYKAQDPDGSNGCPNMAYSSVVQHEYGHYIVNQHGLSQGSFGEGYGDAVGAIINDDPITARDFFGVGQDLRNPILANKQYPCTDEIHECGMVLSGVWWDINLNLEPVVGDAEALALIQQKFTDWTEITVGGSGNNALHPASAIEVLEMFDDDGDPETDGPYDAYICAAFAKHGILCPGIDTILTFEYLNVTPADLVDGGIPCDTEFDMCFVVHGGDLGEPAPNSAKFNYRIPGNPLTTIELTEIAPNTYRATFPPVADAGIIRFSVSAATVSGAEEQDPADGGLYKATASCAVPAPAACDVGGDCEGDINGDGAVDPLDSGYALARFGCEVGTGDAECDAADANADGIVDPLDVGYILSRFGVCP